MTTTGEPAGIGPEIALSLRNDASSLVFVLVGDIDLLRARAQLVNSPVKLCEYKGPSARVEPLALPVLHTSLRHRPSLPGVPDPRNAPYVLKQLQIATEECLSGRSAAVLTCPTHKAVINESGVPFSGHTEYFASQTKSEVAMMLALEHGLKVVLATTHLPLREVAASLDEECVIRAARLSDYGLRSYFNVASPRIMVCGLNPHAGEGGYLGDEELTIIKPAIARLRARGYEAFGPVSADTAFTEQSLSKADVVVAMFHDQALPVIKSIGFKSVINVTLGLPFLRVSVDHGVALDLAGTGRADPSSLGAAAAFAARVTCAQKQINHCA